MLEFRGANLHFESTLWMANLPKFAIVFCLRSKCIREQKKKPFGLRRLSSKTYSERKILLSSQLQPFEPLNPFNPST